MCIKIEVIFKLSLEINDSELPQMSKWDKSLHEKNVPNYPEFPNILLSFSNNFVRVSTLYTRVTFRQYKADISKSNTLTSISQRNISPFPLHLTHLLPHFLLNSTKQQCCLLFSQVSGSPSPGNSCSWLAATYRALTHFSQHDFRLAFLPTFELATSAMALSQPKCRTIPIWKD